MQANTYNNLPIFEINITLKRIILKNVRCKHQYIFIYVLTLHEKDIHI